MAAPFYKKLNLFNINPDKLTLQAKKILL